MTKEQILDLIKLLSAIESWGCTADRRMPDYLYDNLSNIMDVLCAEVLK